MFKKCNEPYLSQHYDQWILENYLSERVRMKSPQYGTGFAAECSEVTESTVTSKCKWYISKCWKLVIRAFHFMGMFD